MISLQELANQIHMFREVCCRLFKKMTGKTITGYLEEQVHSERILCAIQKHTTTQEKTDKLDVYT